MTQSLRSIRLIVTRGLVVLSLLGMAGCESIVYGDRNNGRPSGSSNVAPSEAGGYIVVKGDTLYGISRRYNVQLRDVAQLNRLKAPYTLHVGDLVRLPRLLVYTVRRGDTLSDIAARFRVSASHVARINRLDGQARLGVGQKLLLPQPLQIVADTPAKAQFSKEDQKTKRASSRPAGSKLNNTDKGAKAAPAESNGNRAKAKATQDRASTTKRASVKNKSVSSQSLPRRDGSYFFWPASGPILSSFGSKGNGLHNDGINIKAPKGGEIRAAQNGQVVYVGDALKGFGNLLLIKHDGGWTSAYAHCAHIMVKRGQNVDKGQVVAKAGSSGNVSQPQVHFELRRHARAVNPISHLRPRRGKSS